MKRIELWKAKLKAAKSELKIRTREANAAASAVARLKKTINELEKKIDHHLATT